LYIVDLILTLGNKTLCEICNSKTMKKRHKKVEKEAQAVVPGGSGEQQHHEGSGEHNETHVEEKPHTQTEPSPTTPSQGEFNECSSHTSTQCFHSLSLFF
jgi:hypothetical protein